MGPTKNNESMVPSKPLENHHHRPRRGSMPELKTQEKKETEKKVPTGPRANPLYKTRLCMNYQSTGSCPYTDKCQFAHGVKELEKWENWRNAQKIHDEHKKETPEMPQGGRQRSLSLEKNTGSSRSSSSSSSTLLEKPEFGSPLSLNWDFNSPLRPAGSNFQEEHSSISLSPNFSLWSSFLDDFDDERDSKPLHVRSRAATFDSTYDNMSQLRDAPTLFPSPPVLPMLAKFTTISH